MFLPFLDNRKIYQWIRGLSFGWLGLTILMYLLIIILSNFASPYEMGPGTYRFLILLAPVLRGLVLIAFFVLLLVWVFRSYHNLNAFKLHGLQWSPAMAVIWFLIPAANLIMPYYVLDDIFKGSDPQADVPGKRLKWQDTYPPGGFPGWWLGIALAGVHSIVFSLTGPKIWLLRTLGGTGFYYYTLVIEVCYIFLILTASRLIRDAVDQQEEKWKKLHPLILEGKY